MAIGTPVGLGTASAAAGSTTLGLTTTADAPAGSLILVVGAISNSVSITGVADGAVNVYVAGTGINNGVSKARPFWSVNAAHLASGSTITLTYAGTGGVKLALAVAVAGVAARDIQAASAIGTSTSPSIATGALGWPAEIVFGLCDISSGSADGFTEAAGFTSLASVLSTDALRAAYQIVASAAGVTYAPTLGTSRTWGVNVLTFSAQDGAGRAFAARQSFLTL